MRLYIFYTKGDGIYDFGEDYVVIANNKQSALNLLVSPYLKQDRERIKKSLMYGKSYSLKTLNKIPLSGKVLIGMD